MNQKSVTMNCPKCNEDIDVNSVLTHQLEISNHEPELKSKRNI